MDNGWCSIVTKLSWLRPRLNTYTFKAIANPDISSQAHRSPPPLPFFTSPFLLFRFVWYGMAFIGRRNLVGSSGGLAGLSSRDMSAACTTQPNNKHPPHSTNIHPRITTTKREKVTHSDTWTEAAPGQHHQRTGGSEEERSTGQGRKCRWPWSRRWRVSRARPSAGSGGG